MSVVMHQEINRNLSDRLGKFLPAEMMTNVLETVDEVLCSYEINKLAPAEIGHDYLLDAYLQALEVEGKSPKTLTRYKYVLTRLCKDTGCNSRDITTYHLRKWLADEKARGISDNTLKGDRSVFSAYFGWLHRDGLISKNPVGNISQIKCEKKVKEVFSDIELECLKHECSSLRDRAIVHFLKASGCRIGEVEFLKRSDIDFINRQVIVHGKGNKQRTVYFDAVTAMLVKAYIDSREDDNPYLFVGRGARRLQQGGFRRMLKKLGVKANVNHVYPHKFRRTEITDLVSHGMPIEQVRVLAGHEKIDTTIGYVVLNNETIRSAYQRYA